MAVREFTDENGTTWRAWDIRPDAIHPQTKAEDYLAECYDVGWIVFETLSGDQKRRLCPYPIRWAEATNVELRHLLSRADAVAPNKLAAERQPLGEDAPSALVVSVPPAEDKPDVTDLEVVRSFRYPGGRLWTVSVVPHPEDAGPPVLRFTAGMRSIDLRTWPRDWADAPDQRLVELLRVAAPRPTASSSEPNTPRRRWNDVRA
ncbi:MAG TPA: hypothetical protein VH277_20450 [Gemmatimonadaceae bacterium]|jgi:hypothetical protein|nr:hypothetical protein [Gemmatimonadaceae bacterium]